MLSISPIRQLVSPNRANSAKRQNGQKEGGKNSARPAGQKVNNKIVDITHLVPDEGGDGQGQTGRSTRLFDAFCDFTSISGFRFLHSRHPLWFRIMSSTVLFGSIGMFFYHSSIYVRRFNDKRNSIQMYTTKVANISVPFIIFCPLRQFKTIVDYDGPADFMHIVSRYYIVPNQVPEVDGIPLLNSTKRALDFGLALLERANRANSTQIDELLKRADNFRKDPTFQKLFPECTLLMRINIARRLAQDVAEIYSKYKNFREWQLHMNDSCYSAIIEADPSLQSNTKIIELIRCRAAKLVRLLEQIVAKMENFEEYAHRTKPKLEEYVLFCRWLDGGSCIIEWIPSEIGIDCVRVGGKNQMPASYITLRNNIDIVLDLFAFDNQMSTWEERELRILLAAENQSNVCTSVDGFA